MVVLMMAVSCFSTTGASMLMLMAWSRPCAWSWLVQPSPCSSSSSSTIHLGQSHLKPYSCSRACCSLSSSPRGMYEMQSSPLKSQRHESCGEAEGRRLNAEAGTVCAPFAAAASGPTHAPVLSGAARTGLLGFAGSRLSSSSARARDRWQARVIAEGEGGVASVSPDAPRGHDPTTLSFGRRCRRVVAVVIVVVVIVVRGIPVTRFEEASLGKSWRPCLPCRASGRGRARGHLRASRQHRQPSGVQSPERTLSSPPRSVIPPRCSDP